MVTPFPTTRVLVAVIARRKFVFLDVEIESFCLLLVEVADCLVYHLRDARVLVDVYADVAQLAKSGYDVLRNPRAFHHSRKPGPCAVLGLTVSKFFDELFVFGGDAVGVEELSLFLAAKIIIQFELCKSNYLI